MIRLFLASLFFVLTFFVGAMLLIWGGSMVIEDPPRLVGFLPMGIGLLLVISGGAALDNAVDR